jgi:hypothetical protein
MNGGADVYPSPSFSSRPCLNPIPVESMASASLFRPARLILHILHAIPRAMNFWHEDVIILSKNLGLVWRELRLPFPDSRHLMGDISGLLIKDKAFYICLLLGADR